MKKITYTILVLITLSLSSRAQVLDSVYTFNSPFFYCLEEDKVIESKILFLEDSIFISFELAIAEQTYEGGDTFYYYRDTASYISSGNWSIKNDTIIINTCGEGNHYEGYFIRRLNTKKITKKILDDPKFTYRHMTVFPEGGKEKKFIIRKSILTLIE